MRTLKYMERRTMDANLDLPTYNGKMDLDVAMDWVDALTSLFECEDIPKNQRVKIAKSRIKGSTLTWQNFTQENRVKNKRNPVTTWNKMGNLLRETYVLEDYEVQIHKRSMSMRQKDIDVSTYTKEFQKLVMKSKLVEPKSVKLARYMQGLGLTIQDDLSLTNPTTVNQCFQLALKVEEKFK